MKALGRNILVDLYPKIYDIFDAPETPDVAFVTEDAGSWMPDGWPVVTSWAETRAWSASN